MSVLRLEGVSRWFGNVVALNDVTLEVGPGMTGLLGPNGAGKSTLLSIMAGLLAPSAGSATLDGRPLRTDIELYRAIGLVPVQETLYDFLSARQFVRLNADLQGLPQPGASTEHALTLVDLLGAADRPVRTFSKGMRQRVKLASALVHDPAVLLLDEPFNGLDPLQRQAMASLLQRYVAQGRTIVFSSHILEEVESLAGQIEVVVSGRHAASGDRTAIRRLMTDRPNLYRLRTSDDRRMAAALLSHDVVSGVRLRGRKGMELETGDLGAFAVAAPRLAREHAIRIYEMTPTDESLESIFGYLVNR